MRLLLLTDIHGDIESLEKILESADYDNVLIAGDISDVNEYDDYGQRLNQALDLLDREGVMVYGVPGNMDPEEECVKMLREFRMNTHRSISAFSGIEAVGFGGGSTPFDTAFEPEGEEIKQVLETLFKRMSAETKVAVVHQPPAETDLDIVEGNHVGSPEVRDMVEELDFDLFLTGHIHESFGTDKLNGTLMVNPGPVMEGRYGIAEIEDGEIEVELKQIN